MIRKLSPIDDEELRAQLVRLRRAADIHPRGSYGAIPEDRTDMLRQLVEWRRLLGGALWTDDSWEAGEQHHTVSVQIGDILARAGQARPGAQRHPKNIRELVPRLPLNGFPDGWLLVVYKLARDLAGGHPRQEGRVAHGTLRAVRADVWSRLVVEAVDLDEVGEQAVADAREAAETTCKLCGERGAITRMVSWAGIGRVCWRHEP